MILEDPVDFESGPSAFYDVGDVFHVHDQETAWAIDQLLAHIQALTTVAAGYVIPPQLFARYGLPETPDGRSALMAVLQHECSLITQALTEIASHSASDRHQRLTALRRQVPSLDDLRPRPDDLARQDLFASLVRGETIRAPGR